MNMKSKIIRPQMVWGGFILFWSASLAYLILFLIPVLQNVGPEFWEKAFIVAAGLFVLVFVAAACYYFSEQETLATTGIVALGGIVVLALLALYLGVLAVDWKVGVVWFLINLLSFVLAVAYYRGQRKAH